jgi:hypothetical protein
MLLLAPLARADDEEQPLPLRASVILPSGGRYFVEGTQEIRWGQELSVQKETVIRGRGAGATLVVEGALQVRGVTAKRVVIEDLVIEVAERCERVHLDNVILRRCAIRTAKEKPSEARVHVESCELSETPIELSLVKGEVTILATDIKGAFTLVGVKAEQDQKNPPPVRLLLNMCNTNRDFVVDKAKHVVIRGNGIYSPKCSFTDCAELEFDANVVKNPGVLIAQSEAGKLKKTNISKCDFHGSVLTLKAPRDGKKKDKVPVDKCWFMGRTKAKEIVGKDIRDGTVDETSGAYAVMRKINDRPLELGGLALGRDK